MIESTQREEELFAAALALPAAERSAFLDRTVGEAADTGLRRRVDNLLRAHERADDLEAPFHSVQQEAEAARVEVVAADSLVGTRIERFNLLECIGEGGCGVVYLAEQDEPVRRRVALKVIKAGMDTAAVIARFEAERQALALMDHPNIARVFDGGATASGRPYFVMELVRGVPITHYCDQAKLGTRERLQLFLKVCDAVRHAHQKGIIHRDLKPSNILVALNDGVAVPKVIDFGIAKAVTGARLTDKTLFTRFNDFIGTPAYMSPEQALMTTVDVDTRSDIYSLGVVLYELLTAQLPFDRATLDQAGVDEARRLLREVDPARPSLRVSALTAEERTTVAQRRGIEPAKLVVLLRSDLDWIVLRCLEKDRARRYETVSDLTRDIQRHLDEEPVLARPPSAGYRLKKLVRRHRVAVIAGTAVFVALTLGFALSTWQAIRATRAEREQNRQRELANTARTHAEGLLGFLLEDFYDELQPVGRVEIVGRLARQMVAYYDSLPVELRNEDTDRNRALARLREGGALIRGKHFAQGAAALQDALDFFEKRYEAKRDDESATLDLATALWAQFFVGHYLAVNTQIPRERVVERFRRASNLARSYATRPNASVHARRTYAEAIAALCGMVGLEESIPYAEEALALLRGLGATDGTAPNLTVVYCFTANVRASAYLEQGKFDAAERIGDECDGLLAPLLAKRPGDLEALAARSIVLDTRSLVAERRFQLARATELAERAELAVAEYARFDEGGAAAQVVPWFERMRVSDLYWRLGRVQDSLQKAYAVLAEIDSFSAGRDVSIPETAYWHWQTNMYRELERGDFVAADRCVKGLTREAEKLRQFGCGWEVYLAEITQNATRSAERRGATDHVRAFADAEAALNRATQLPYDKRYFESEGYWQGYWRILHGGILCGVAASGGLAGRDAEVEMLVRREGRKLRSGDFNLDTGQLEPHLWLALALARQKKSAECSEELKPMLAYYYQAWNKGDQSIDNVRGMGFSLYVQAINEPDNPEGKLRRRAALDEAQAVLATLTDEAKQLVSYRMVIDWVETERARPL